MKTTLGELRRLVRETVKDDCWGGSYPEETYDEELVEDDDLKKHSVYVPDDVKAQIGTYFKKMGLAGTKKRK